MRRTHVLLKEQQYRALKARARREGKSLSELVRTAVAQWLGPRRDTGARLADLCALGQDPQGPTGRDHDAVLYNWERKRSTF